MGTETFNKEIEWKYDSTRNRTRVFRLHVWRLNPLGHRIIYVVNMPRAAQKLIQGHSCPHEFLARFVEHLTGNQKVMNLIPISDSGFFLTEFFNLRSTFFKNFMIICFISYWLCTGYKGNLAERTMAILISIILGIPALFIELYLLIWQTYV